MSIALAGRNLNKTAALFARSCNEVDCGGDDKRAKYIREKRMFERHTAQVFGRKLSVGHLKSHAHGKGKLGKISVGWVFGHPKVYPTFWCQVVQFSIVQHEKLM